MAMRWPITSTASMASLWVFAQRAIWLRLLPTRATCRVRSRSTSACATVQVRVRPTARRTRSDSVRPAERALACHSARSASPAADLHPHAAPGAHAAPPTLRGDEGAQPPASLRRGRAKRGPKEYAGFPALAGKRARRGAETWAVRIAMPYSQGTIPGGVNDRQNGDIPRVPASSRRWIGCRQRRLHRPPVGPEEQPRSRMVEYCPRTERYVLKVFDRLQRAEVPGFGR